MRLIRRLLRRPTHAASEGAVPPVASKPSPPVSVVLGSYNRKLLLQAAIESIRENGLAQAPEIIVVDGGSSDGSLAWLSEQKDVIAIIQHNRGEFRGRAIPRRSWGYFMNLGFRIAQSKWILMISDDCVLLPGAIQNSLDHVAALHAKGRSVGGVAYHFRNWPQDQRYYVQETIGGRLMVNHGLFSREALRRVDYANETDYVFYKADGDLSLRIWGAGYEIVASPHSIVEHFMDEQEAVRQLNNAVLDRDRATYAKQWGHLTGKPRRIEIDAQDGLRTAERVFGAHVKGRADAR